jgi:hypothetical protein
MIQVSAASPLEAASPDGKAEELYVTVTAAPFFPSLLPKEAVH